ncbi:hypothetical protein ACFSO0_07060 [Brevibacillus sp. GCM10020057]|uniref:hypothetical protein n=1 Tax=Brevibacillus sp. GCM10020057 TaxID=3317327 RepID=UPI00362C48B8
MKRAVFACFLTLGLLGSVLPAGAAAADQTVQQTHEPSVIYQIAADGTSKKVVAQLPYMHRGAISPSGRYLYAERIGYGKTDPTVPYLYNLQTKKLTQLSGFAKWSPKRDMLYILEKGGIILVNPADGTKSVLVAADPQYPVLDFLVSPDEQYMAFLRKDLESVDHGTATHLYLQHLPTGKMKINDRFAWEPPASRGEEQFYWLPTSKKLFYCTQGGIKELDLPTGLKYVHKLTSFPSYSADMKYRYVMTEKEEYLLDLQTGKKVMLLKQAQPITEGNLSFLSWSPAGHAFAAEKFFRPSNSQDAYCILQYYREAPKYSLPFGGVGASQYSPFLSKKDNVRLIGWAKDGKSFYVADWSSIHFSDFAPEKLSHFYQVIENDSYVASEKY